MEKKTVAEEDYNFFLQFKKNKELSLSKIIPAHKRLKAKIKADISMLAKSRVTKYSTVLTFIKWINQQTNSNYYLFSIGPDGGISLIKTDLEVLLNIGHRTIPSNQAMLDIIGGQQPFLEIQTIYSAKKGEGYNIMQKIIKLAKNINYPITLYAETESNVRYFERYGFINHGKHGDNGEYLMILMP